MIKILPLTTKARTLACYAQNEMSTPGSEPLNEPPYSRYHSGLRVDSGARLATTFFVSNELRPLLSFTSLTSYNKRGLLFCDLNKTFQESWEVISYHSGF